MEGCRSNQGKRVVVGQRIMQAASDVFLGWARAGGFDTYVRQLRDMKGTVELDDARPDDLTLYGRLCAAALARAHARAGHPALISCYLPAERGVTLGGSVNAHHNDFAVAEAIDAARLRHALSVKPSGRG
ncbi:MAG TPA: DUF2252 family protein [Acidimicrobiales bacterium]